MSQPAAPESSPTPSHGQSATPGAPAPHPAGAPPGAPQQQAWNLAPPTNPPRKNRAGLVTGLVIGGVLLLCLCGGLVAAVGGGSEQPTAGDDPATTDAATTTSPAGDEETNTQPEPAGKLGQPVRDGKFEFVVKSVKCGVKRLGGQFGKKAQGQFCLAKLSIKNIGDEPQMFNDFDQSAYDAAGREYKPDSEAGWYANENNTDVWLNEINPGNRVSGVLVFDVPKDTKLSTLELHDSGFSGGVEVSLAP